MAPVKGAEPVARPAAPPDATSGEARGVVL